MSCKSTVVMNRDSWPGDVKKCQNTNSNLHSMSTISCGSAKFRRVINELQTQSGHDSFCERICMICFQMRGMSLPQIRIGGRGKKEGGGCCPGRQLCVQLQDSCKENKPSTKWSCKLFHKLWSHFEATTVWRGQQGAQETYFRGIWSGCNVLCSENLSLVMSATWDQWIGSQCCDNLWNTAYSIIQKPVSHSVKLANLHKQV